MPPNLSRLNNKITGIILAGGKSRRLGADKGLFEIMDRPLISYSIDVLEKVCDQILISSNNIEYEKFGYRVVGDKIANAGPASGILSCLEVSDTRFNLVLSCDMPFVTEKILLKLLESADMHQVVIPSDKNNLPEPLCGYYADSFKEIANRAISDGHFKVIDIVKRSKHKIITLNEVRELIGDKTFFNINSREDAKFAERFF